MTTRSKTIIYAGLVTILLATAIRPAGAGDSTFVANIKPSLEIPRISTPIKIDGELDDEGWQKAAKATNFTEHFPRNKEKPPVKTEAFIAYDNTNLYVAFIAYDDPGSIRCSLRNRDEIWQDDYIGFLMDTFADAVTAYEIFVNPIGIQGDGISTPKGEDMSFDIVYQSRGKITDKGYQVELAIPFSSLRFPNKEDQTWKITFWRTRPRASRSQYTWAWIDENQPCWSCQFGTISGIKNVKPGGKIELLPFVTGFQSASLAPSSVPGSKLENGEINGRAGFGARYFLSTCTTAEAAYKPDFSQVESDASQIDVNTTFALFYSEKRPFFQEGSDMFSLRNNVFYSRSVNDPLVAAKLTGRIKKTDFAYLVAYDRHSPLIIPFEERSAVIPTVGKTTSNVLRIRRPFLASSYAGAILVDRRREGEGAGSVVGTDGTIQFLKKYSFNWEALISRTVEPNDTLLSADINSRKFDRDVHTAAFDGEVYSGNACFAEIRRDTKRLSAGLRYNQVSPAFRAENGYVTRNNSRQGTLESQVAFFPKSGIADRFGTGFEAARVWNFEGVPKDGWVVPYFFATLKHQTSVTLEYIYTKEKFRDVQFPAISRVELNVESNFSEPLGAGMWMETGPSIARFLSPPVMGSGTNFSVWATVKPLNRLVVEPSFERQSLKQRDDGTKLFTESVLRTRFSWQFTRRASTRVIVEYSDQRVFVYDSVEKAFRFEPLFTYKINPFTVFYIGSSRNYGDYGTEAGLTQTERQYFLKLQYLFRV